MYCWFVRSRAIVTGPNTSTACPWASRRQSVRSFFNWQSSTTGESLELNVPAWKNALGSGTSGGRKKKCELPPLCAPSEIMYAGPAFAAGCRGCWSRQPTERTAAAVTTRVTCFMPSSLARADQRLEARIVLQGAPPPVHVLPEPLAMLRVGNEVLLEQPQRLVLVAQHRAHERLVAEQLALRIDAGVSRRAPQHVTGAVGEARPREDGRDIDLLEQARP